MGSVLDPVYLVRHGESEWNVQGLTQGSTSHPRLTALGRAQMAAAAESLRAVIGPGALVQVTSSDLTRAVESAVVVAERLGASRVVDLRWRERGFGLFQGSAHQRTTRWVGAAEGAVRAHGGVEAPEAALARARSALAALGPGRQHVVVAHGELLRLLAGTESGTGAETGGGGVVGNGQVLRWDGRSAHPV